MPQTKSGTGLGQDFQRSRQIPHVIIFLDLIQGKFLVVWGKFFGG